MAPERALVMRRLELTEPGEKLLVPAMFRGASFLEDSAFHSFLTAGNVKEKLDKGMVEWAAPSVIYALLDNAEMFWVDVTDQKRFHGGCALVKKVHFADDVEHPHGYSEEPDSRVREKEMKNVKGEVAPGVTNTPILKRFDAYGKVWHRRRYTLDSDDTYSFIQWMDAKAIKLKEKPVSTMLTDVTGNIKSLQESYGALKHDVADMKVLLQNVSTLAEASLALAQSLKEVVQTQTTANAALSEQMSRLRSDLRRGS